MKRIVGRVEKDGPVTLDGCLRKTISADAKSGLSKSIFDVSKAFIGAAYGDEENPRFNTVKFSVERLDNWLGITGLEIEERIEDGKVTISYQPPAVLEMKLSNNMQLSIGFSWTGPAPQGRKIGELRIGQKAFFKIEATNLCELDEFISIYDRVTKLLCFALDDIVLLDSITATSDNLRESGESVGRQMTPMAPIRIYYLSGPLPKNESTKLQWYCLFRFDTIKSQAERLINNWLDGYEKLSLTLDLYFWTQMKDSQFLEVKFLTLVQGLEVCHRRTSNETQMDNTEFEDLVASLLAECPDDKRKWLQEKFRYGNELSLRKRIKAIIEPFKEIVGDKKQRNVLIHQIVIMRNFLTHGDKSFGSGIRESRFVVSLSDSRIDFPALPN